MLVAARDEEDRSRRSGAEGGVSRRGDHRRRRRLPGQDRRGGRAGRRARRPAAAPREGTGAALAERTRPRGRSCSRRRPARRPRPARRVGHRSGDRRFAEKPGGGLGIAKRTGRPHPRARGFEPASHSRASGLSRAARRSCFPLAAGFGCEVRMTSTPPGPASRSKNASLRCHTAPRDAIRRAPTPTAQLRAPLTLQPSAAQQTTTTPRSDTRHRALGRHSVPATLRPSPQPLVAPRRPTHKPRPGSNPNPG